MNMALEDYSWAREYLQRHRIHRLFEECIEALVISRPSGREEVTGTIVGHVRSVQQQRRNRAQKVFFAVGLPEAAADDVVSELVRQREDSLTAVDAAAFPSVPALVAHILTCRGSVILTGFPRTIKDAVVFQAEFGDPARCILFTFSNFSAGASSVVALGKDPRAAEKAFAMHVNPVAAFYGARGLLSSIAVDDDAAPPLTALRQIVEEA